MSYDMDSEFRQWHHLKYPAQAFEEAHRLVGSSHGFGYSLDDLKAAFVGGAMAVESKLKEADDGTN